MATRNLLVELGTEELPPRSLHALAQAFAASLVQGLREAALLPETSGYRHFATPRRLAVLVEDVAAKQPARTQERRGPSVQVAFEDGTPTRAAQGFAQSCGTTVSQLQRMENDQGAWLVFRQKIAGEKLADILTRCLESSVRQLPIPKRMRWGEGQRAFIRPVHWLLVLHGTSVVPTQVLGLRAGRFTRGHRFHAPQKLAIPRAEAYARLLESDGRVIADFARRRDLIQKQIHRLAGKAPVQLGTPSNAKPLVKVAEDADLLDLVTSLVEWPVALRGEFDRRFLRLPPEVLVACMRDHQKYFHLIDAKGKLLPGFIAISNIASTSPARTRHGNERVLRARLADAEFFWNSDRKTPLAARVPALEGVLFHHKLGSLHAKSARVAELAGIIAQTLGADLQASVETTMRAAWLCKADLVTDMVGEFPELQGVMGRYYAKQSGEPKEVADAIEQHYLPRFAGDRLPRSAVAQSVAVADRVDSLVGLFASGEVPSGDKDPFALRRAALGVLRILIEQKLDLDLYALLQASGRIYADADTPITPSADFLEAGIEQVFAFMLERLKAYYQPQGYSVAELSSVLACQPHSPLDFHHRLTALSGFFKRQPEVANLLAAANKRIANILSNETIRFAGEEYVPRYDETLLRDAAEIQLAQGFSQVAARARAAFRARQYAQGLLALAELKEPVDSFFDEVMVMDEDAAIRNNRLALLRRIRELFLEVADISHMRAER